MRNRGAKGRWGGLARGASWATLLVASVASSPALAEPADDEKVLSDVRFREGRAALDQKNIDVACTKFEESEKLWPRGGTALNLGACREAQGKVASAWAAYTRAIALAQREARADREELARKKVEELTPQLSWLVITIAPEIDSPTLVVTRNGVPVGRGAWGVPVQVDPGRQVVRAGERGGAPLEATIEVGPRGDRKTISLPAAAYGGPPTVGGYAPGPYAPFVPAAPPKFGAPGAVKVHIETGKPELGLWAVNEQAYGAPYGAMSLAHQVCLTPCDVVVDARSNPAFYFAGESIPPSGQFTLGGRGAEVTASVSAGSTAMRSWGYLLIVLGGSAAVAGGVLIPVGVSENKSSTSGRASDGGSSSSLLTTGVVTAVSGGVALAGGIALVVLGGTSYKLEDKGPPRAGLTPRGLVF